MKLCLRNPMPYFDRYGKPTVWDTFLRDPRVGRVIDRMTWPHVYDYVREAMPEKAELWAYSDICFGIVNASSNQFSSWLNPTPERQATHPDVAMSAVYHQNWGKSWRGFWYGADNNFLIANGNEIITTPGETLIIGEFMEKTNLQAWATMYKRFHSLGKFDGFSIDMTPWHLSGKKFQGYLSPGAFEDFEAFTRTVSLAGIPILQNSVGRGPNATGHGAGYLFERFGDQSGGVNVTGTLWDFIATIERQGIVGGLSSLTPSQLRQSVLCINPRSAEGDDYLTKLGLATALLFGVGYVSAHAQWRSQLPWVLGHGFDDWFDLVPVDGPQGALEIAWYGSKGLWDVGGKFGGTFPTAQWCVEHRAVLRRIFQDSTGRRWRVIINPNDVAGFGMAARSAKKVPMRVRRER